MDLHHQFEVAAAVDHTWSAFLDMPRVAPCMPGAEVTEVIDERNIKGDARVKVGPLNLRFAGQAEITQIDDSSRSALMIAKGSDAKGRGSAETEVRFSLSEAGDDRTLVDLHTELTLSGSVAQYGRVSGLIDEIANQLIAEFVENLEVELAQAATPTAAPAPTPKAVSGLSVFFRALGALIKKWFRRS